MGMKNRSYWWVSCDGECSEMGGCHAGDNLEDGLTEFEAEQNALQHGWAMGPGRRWYCPKHKGSLDEQEPQTSDQARPAQGQGN